MQNNIRKLFYTFSVLSVFSIMLTQNVNAQAPEPDPLHRSVFQFHASNFLLQSRDIGSEFLELGYAYSIYPLRY